MEGQIPWWVAAITAIAGSFVMPLIDRLTALYKNSDEKALALAKLTDEKATALALADDAKDEKFMTFLRVELEASRKAEQMCRESYHAAMEEIRKLSMRCAKLEAIVVHLHPEVATDILKASP